MPKIHFHIIFYNEIIQPDIYNYRTEQKPQIKTLSQNRKYRNTTAI